ncbi:hypothetical protein D3C76_1603920 [compost metagenome]
MVKFLYCFDQTHITFLNQIQEQHTASDITFRDTYYETQVRFCKTAFSFFIAILNPHSKLHFIVCRQQRNASDFF